MTDETREQINANNEKIARFMGLRKNMVDNGVWPVGAWYDSNYSVITVPDYHIKWGELMPVARKSKDILQEIHKSMPVHSASNGDLIDVDISFGLISVDITMVYRHLVKFIDWYNENEVKG